MRATVYSAISTAIFAGCDEESGPVRMAMRWVAWTAKRFFGGVCARENTKTSPSREHVGETKEGLVFRSHDVRNGVLCGYDGNGS